MREPSDADLERIVEFQNRYATPAQWTTVAAARHGETAAPEPNRKRLIVEDESGGVVAFGRTGDGGLFRPSDGSWSLGLRVDPRWRRRGVGAAVLERLEEHARTKGASRTVAAVRGSTLDVSRRSAASASLVVTCRLRKLRRANRSQAVSAAEARPSRSRRYQCIHSWQ